MTVDAAIAALPSVFFSSLNLRVDGDPFCLYPDYAYLVEPYDCYFMEDPPQHLVIEKGAQQGWTVLSVLGAIYGAYAIYGKQVIYYFPSERSAGKFSQSRCEPMLNENARLTEIVGKTNSTFLKAIRNVRAGVTFLNFVGMKSAEALKSTPADHLYFDEADEMDDRRIARARHRLDASRFARRTYLSTPTLPHYGIDLQFERSDRRYWLIRCEHCNEHTCLEHEFPDCLHRLKDGTVIRACKQCGREIYPRNGRWVAEQPSIDVARGYRISQLCSAHVKPVTILNEYETGIDADGKDLDWPEFYNQRLARGHVESDASLSRDQVLECCGDDPKVLRAPGPTAIGVDVRKDMYHWIASHRVGHNRAKVLGYGIAPTQNAIYDIAQAFGVGCLVQDAMPDVNSTKIFCEENSWAWRTFLPDKFSMSTLWDYRAKTVKSSRNDAIEAAFNAVVARRVELPRRDATTETLIVNPFINMAKTTQIDEETGIPTVRWVVLGTKNNDMWMAFVHMWLALSRVSDMASPTIGSRGASPLQLGGYDPLALVDQTDLLPSLY